jgi:hypothetical protein
VSPRGERVIAVICVVWCVLMAVASVFAVGLHAYEWTWLWGWLG